MKDGLFIVFMGLDGTGKSTQAEKLRARLGGAFPGAVIIHHCSPVFQPARAVKRVIRTRAIEVMKLFGVHRAYKGGEGGEVKAEERSNLFGSGIGALIGGYIVLVGFVKSWYHYVRYRRRGLLYDRCFLDDMVKARLRFGGGWGLGKALLRRVPRPRACIVFRAPVETSFSRKKAMNCTIEEYRMKGRILDEALALAAEHGWNVRELDIEGRSPEEVFAEVEAAVFTDAEERHGLAR